MGRYDYLIWDFNGTLLDDVITGIESVNKLLADRGLATIKSKEQYRSIFRFPIIDYYRALGFDFDTEPYEVLAPQWVELYLENVKRATLYGDVLQTLEYAKELGIKQAILSATERSMLIGQLEELGIAHYFDRIMGLDTIHAGSKLALASAWRAQHPDSRALFVGDTDHDAQTAEQLGADCLLICRGHQSKEFLLTLGVPVADNLSAVSELLA